MAVMVVTWLWGRGAVRRGASSSRVVHTVHEGRGRRVGRCQLQARASLIRAGHERAVRLELERVLVDLGLRAVAHAVGARVAHQLQILDEIGGRLGQIGDRLALHALKVHVSTLGLLLLPGHVNERPLHVVVDDLGLVARADAHLFLVRRVAFDAEAELLEAAVLEDLFGYVAIFDIFKKPVQTGAVNDWNDKTARSEREGVANQTSGARSSGSLL